MFGICDSTLVKDKLRLRGLDLSGEIAEILCIFVPQMCKTVGERGDYAAGWARCASWSRNPKGPQITSFCHQLGRPPTVLRKPVELRRRISAWISPGGVPMGLERLFVHIHRGDCQMDAYGPVS